MLRLRPLDRGEAVFATGILMVIAKCLLVAYRDRFQGHPALAGPKFDRRVALAMLLNLANLPAVAVSIVILIFVLQQQIHIGEKLTPKI